MGFKIVDGQAAEKMGTEARGERAECCGVEEAPGVWKESGEVLKLGVPGCLNWEMDTDRYRAT